MAILNNSNAISSGGYDIKNSLRIRKSASAFLNRTPASAGNRKTWTWSGWVKRGTLSDSEQALFHATSGNPTGNLDYGTGIRFVADNTLQLYSFVNSAFDMSISTTQVFRDPSAWYHIVFAVDTTQATSSNRIKLYVNGNQVTALTTATYPALNYDTYVNSTNGHFIGKTVTDSSNIDFFDGYLAEVNFIDGQALTPSSFGETDTTTGVWKPKAYTSTYGTNGFELTFSDIATTSGSNAGLGKDFSGNSNYWTTNNISVTSGTTYDAMTDSPTNTSATVANYAVMNPVYKSASQPTFSNANLTIASNTANYQNSFSTIETGSTGKYYCEFTIAGNVSSALVCGISNTTERNYFVTTADVIGATSGGYSVILQSGSKYTNGAATSYGSAFNNGDVIQIAYDADNGKIWFGKNGTWFASGNPASGTNEAFSGITGNYCFGVTAYQHPTLGTSTYHANFGQRPFSYTSPTGFVALNTFNLPNSTVVKGNSYMDAIIYTGDGASTKTISGLNFQPDFLWIKRRDGASDHNLQDAVRGFSSSTKLASSSNYAENTLDGLYTDPKWGYVSSVSSTGFTVTKSTNGDHVNVNASPYVAWAWDANGAGATNTAGSITSTVSVNTTAGFSVVTYTGNGGTGATVGHGLGVAPKMVIVKQRSGAEAWVVGHQNLTGWNYILNLNSTAAQFIPSTQCLGTPTSTNIVVGPNASTNSNTATYVAYCWAEIAGFSKFGSYTGNGSTDGPFVYLGFRPKFVMVKRSSTTGDWFILDTSRDSFNVEFRFLYPNLSNAEETSSVGLDGVSNGFKIRNTFANINASGSTYIYMAFAENPQKYSLGR